MVRARSIPNAHLHQAVFCHSTSSKNEDWETRRIGLGGHEHVTGVREEESFQAILVCDTMRHVASIGSRSSAS